MISPFHDSNSRAVARIHRSGIEAGFISSLGLRFVSSLYRAINRDPGSVVLCAMDDGNVAGFIAGTVSTEAMYRWILPRYGILFAAQLIPSLSRPANLRRIWETIRYAEDTGAVRGPSSGNPVKAELLAIAVDRTKRGKGIGRELLVELEAWFISRGVRSYKVVTAASDPISNRFYVRYGFVKTRSFRHHGNDMNEYLRDIPRE